jgi:hypothetical protein
MDEKSQVGANRRGYFETMLRWRWALSALGAVVAIVLIASGAVLIGVLLGVMAIVRALMLTKMTRRHREIRARYSAQGSSEPQ